MDSSSEDPPIKTYLDQLCVWLALLPSQERVEVRAEVRQHIELIASGEGERGAAPADAVTLALDKMGDADAFGKRLLDARLKQAQRQMGVWMPPDLIARTRVLNTLGIAWSVVFLLPALWFAFHACRIPWPVALGFGAAAGAGYGALIGWYNCPPPTVPPMPHPNRTVTLPPLPDNASPRGRRHYRSSAWLMKLGTRTSNRTYDLLRVILPVQIGTVTFFGCMTQGTNFMVARQFSSSALRDTLGLAAFMASLDLTALVVSWSLKRRLA